MMITKKRTSCKSLLRALVIDTKDSVESVNKGEVKECFEENYPMQN